MKAVPRGIAPAARVDVAALSVSLTPEKSGSVLIAVMKSNWLTMMFDVSNRLPRIV